MTPKLSRPLSLRPDATLIEANAMNNPIAKAITNSWRFQFPIRHVSVEDPMFSAYLTFEP